VVLSGYSQTLKAAGGSGTGYTWSAPASNLPAGLSLSSGGVLSGPPSTAGTFSFSVQVTDSAQNTATQSFALTVLSPTTGLPAPPQVTIDTTFPDTTNYTVTTVAAGANLQSAINNASCNPNGTVLRLASGATFTGNYTLPAKSCATDQWIIIRTDTADSNLPPQGTRITPNYSSVLAKIMTASAGAAIKTSSGANHYWFMGVEIGIASTVTVDNYDLFVVGSSETSTSALPSYIFIDRCYLHGNGTSNAKRGLAANGSYIAAVDSYFENFAYVGVDSQAICAWNSPGPLKIVDNFLEGAANNILFGGADPAISGLVPSDIEIRKNHFFKPFSWMVGNPAYAGIHWSVKNLLEFKNAQRVLIEGNVFENNWADAQTGISVLLTPKNSSGGCTWCIVADVTIQYNVFAHMAGWLDISAGFPAGYPGGPSLPTQRVSVHDNLVYDVSGVYSGGSGGLFLKFGTHTPVLDFHDVLIAHNTAFFTGNTTTFGDTLDQGTAYLAIQDNIALYNTYGVSGSGTAGNALATLNSYCVNPPDPGGWVFTNDVIYRPAGAPSNFPSGNFFPTSWDNVAFVDSTNCPAGNFTPGDVSMCALSSSSPYHNAGTDGKDIGADISGLIAAVAGVWP
jgi:hypothetical protein